MKKILSIVIALMTFAGIASAQIIVNKTKSSKAEQMTTLSMYWSWIYKVGDSYYLVLKSDNQFDDYFWLKLGTTKQECRESIFALQEMMDEMGDTDIYNVQNGEGDSFTVTITTEFGTKRLVFRSDNYAGSGSLIPSNLNKAIKWIEKNVK